MIPTHPREQRSAIVRKCLDTLGEHFEAVQILASESNPDAGGTEHFFLGRGNWFARQGMAHHFIQSDQSDTLAAAITPPPPLDGESWKTS